ncbi:MAG: hypothetical protein LBJ00_12930 [Planctomycetaceae bacterium]|jgi:hypothetical protein|nr:hypothetical protein [Planctomycetaceae bacterium]
MKTYSNNNHPYMPASALYTQAVLKFLKLDTQAQQREVVVRGEAYRLTGYGIDSKIIPKPTQMTVFGIVDSTVESPKNNLYSSYT